jgi:hypothetical protein
VILISSKTTPTQENQPDSPIPTHQNHCAEPLAWSKVKTDLRRVAARTTDALHQALGPALDAITAQHASGCFRHAGYIRPK